MDARPACLFLLGGRSGRLRVLHAGGLLAADLGGRLLALRGLFGRRGLRRLRFGLGLRSFRLLLGGRGALFLGGRLLLGALLGLGLLLALLLLLGLLLGLLRLLG